MNITNKQLEFLFVENFDAKITKKLIFKNETIVRLKTVVDEIDWLNNDNKVRIKCLDGELFQADVVIFTGYFLFEKFLFEKFLFEKLSS